MEERRAEWEHVLSGEETRALLEACRARGDDGVAAMAARVAALPCLRSRSARWRRELHEGSGVSLIRGVPTGDMSPAERAAVFLAVGETIGRPVSQNAMGHLLGHVYDLGGEMRAERRLYTTSLAQPFHTDSCDVVGLLCIQRARSGGESSVVSSSRIFSEVRRRDARLARVLTESFFNDRKGEKDDSQLPYFEMPVFMENPSGRLLSMYDRTFIDAAQARFAGEVPPLTAEQVAALDLCDELCTRDELRLDMELLPGDIQLLHNHNTWHARASYVDDAGRKRHLLRLWLSTKSNGGWELPAVFAERYGRLDGDVRGGVNIEGVEGVVPLSPAS